MSIPFRYDSVDGHFEAIVYIDERWGPSRDAERVLVWNKADGDQRWAKYVLVWNKADGDQRWAKYVPAELLVPVDDAGRAWLVELALGGLRHAEP